MFREWRERGMFESQEHVLVNKQEQLERMAGYLELQIA